MNFFLAHKKIIIKRHAYEEECVGVGSYAFNTVKHFMPLLGKELSKDENFKVFLKK